VKAYPDDVVGIVTRLNWHYCHISRSVGGSGVGLAERVEEVSESTEVKLLEKERMSGGVTGTDGFNAFKNSSSHVDSSLLLCSTSSEVVQILEMGSIHCLEQFRANEVWVTLLVVEDKCYKANHVV
jgi:hypothetical protein